ncbi:hypothetical protein, conserved [Eimeria brunetti]|uniref:Uncharacterized protein n=1 Tax=Eimeria brunetti TaxID=51314 RepID=U6LDU3_9EIME|nr:hypothetical protein, conserved [Eimeria brunetti]
MRSAADLPFDPSLAPSPTVADLLAVTEKEGNLVGNGVVADFVAAVQPATLTFDPSDLCESSWVRYLLSFLQQDFVEIYAWCRGSADLQVMYPLLYNYVGSSKKEEPGTEQPVSLVASKPSSHVVLREVRPGLEENVRRFILQFQCKSEGESIVGLDFPFHGYRDVQIFLKKKCVAPASLRDPSCSSGVLSEDGVVCCAASCGSCGGDGCEEREGGLAGCCAKHIVSSALPCAVTTAPCVMIAQQNRATKELRMNLALPEEPPTHSRRFSLLLAPLWLIRFCLSILRMFLWCFFCAALLVYIFTVGYGIHVLKEPLSVATAPSLSQLANSIMLIVGHLRHLYKTHSGSLFAGEGFHSYTPFEEKGAKPSRKLSSKENPFCPPVRWRSSEEHNSCIRLTSLKAKAARETSNPNLQAAESIRPMEFCDIEADAANVRDRNGTEEEDTLWEGPQSDFQADVWADDSTTILNPQNETDDRYPTPQGSQHYRQFAGNSYEPF